MFLQGFILLLVGLSILLIPWRSYQTGAYPENLYTSTGQWSKPANPAHIFRCVRTEYGLGLSWLVYDRGVSEDAWYVKLNEFILKLHVLLAITASVCGVYILRRTPKQLQSVMVGDDEARHYGDDSLTASRRTLPASEDRSTSLR